MTIDVARTSLSAPGALDGLGEEWRALHARSAADPLFMSWDWMHSWWRHHQARFAAELVAFIARDRSGYLLGIALATLRSARHRGGLSARRLELCGNFWRESDTVMSERIGFLLDRTHSDRVAAAIWQSILDQGDWDDFVLTYVDAGDETLRARPTAEHSETYVRATDGLDAYEVVLGGAFADYLSTLRYGPRRRIFAGRHKLPAGTTHEFCSSEAHLGAMLKEHDRLHQVRWGAQAFEGRRGRLYRELAERSLARGTLALHGLRSGDSYLATSFNIRAGAREYVLQSAFDASCRGFAPGHLLVGYVIERAIADGIEAVDLLGGGGRTTQFKSGYGARQTRLECVQLVRSRLLKTLYSTYDRWRRTAPRSDVGGEIDS